MALFRLNVTDTIVVSGGRPYSFIDNYYNSVPYKIKLNINYFSQEGSIRTGTTFKVTVTNNDKVNVANITTFNGNGSFTINDDFTGSTKVDISLIIGQNENPINILPGTILSYTPSSQPSKEVQETTKTSYDSKGYGKGFILFIIIFFFIFLIILLYALSKKRKPGKPNMSFSKRISKR